MEKNKNGNFESCSKCPYCLYEHYILTPINKRVSPSEGDYSLCSKCDKISMFDENLILIKHEIPIEEIEINLLARAYRQNKKRREKMN